MIMKKNQNKKNKDNNQKIIQMSGDKRNDVMNYLIKWK